ncbi:MAG: hypothetical protein FWG65_10795 [Turicibacter sp.]|nr:hypothetical protein [Turicibacter sp.]
MDVLYNSETSNASKVKEPMTLRELIWREKELTLEEYVEKYPYDIASYVEFGRKGIEEI